MIFTRVPFQVVNLEVDKMYQIDFSEFTEEQAEEHYKLIKEFIHACGWTSKDFVEELFGFNNQN